MQIKSVVKRATARVWIDRIQRGTEQVEQSQQVLSIVKASQNDQHDVYTTGAGSVMLKLQVYTRDWVWV